MVVFLQSPVEQNRKRISTLESVQVKVGFRNKRPKDAKRKLKQSGKAVVGCKKEELFHVLKLQVFLLSVKEEAIEYRMNYISRLGSHLKGKCFLHPNQTSLAMDT